MNILIVSAVFPPEPVVSSILSYDIAEELVDMGNTVSVICPRPTRPFGYNINNDDPVSLKFQKITLLSITCPESRILGRFRESFSFGSHTYRFIKEHHKSIDVIYGNTWPLFAQFLLVKAARKYNIPVILHIQDIYPESIALKQNKIWKKIIMLLLVPFDRMTLKKCTRIVCISPAMKEHLVNSRQIDAEKIYVVRNWQHDDKFLEVASTERSDNSDFVFMYLGSLTPSAGIDVLIHAFALVKLPKCKLIIAGEGSGKSEYLKLADLYKNEKIEFIPAPNDQVHNIQQIADVLLLPLKKGLAKTATPSKLTAYMYSGKPIIASVDKDSDTAESINEANCGMVIEPSDIDEMARAMKQLVNSDRTLLAEYGKNSLKYAIDNLSKKNNLKKIASIITESFNDNKTID